MSALLPSTPPANSAPLGAGLEANARKPSPPLRCAPPPLPHIAELGDAALPHLEKSFADAASSREFLKAIALTCGRIGNPKADTFHKQHISHHDGAVRSQVLSAHVRSRENNREVDVPQERVKIAREVEEAAWALAAWRDIERDGAQAELARALPRRNQRTQAARLSPALPWFIRRERYHPQGAPRSRNQQG